MQGIRPQNLTDQELLDYAHLTGYDKLSVEWVSEIADRLHNLLISPPDTAELSERYQSGYDDGYSSGYAAGCEDSEDDGK